MFDNPVLYLLKAEMVFVEDFLCVFEVEVILRIFVPRQFDKIFEIVMLDTVVSDLRVHTLEFLQLLIKYCRHLLAPFFLGSLFCQILNILFVRSPAEFLLNGAQLLVQEILSLLPVHIHLYLALYLLFKVNHLHLVVKQLKQIDGELNDVVYFEQPLAVIHI